MRLRRHRRSTDEDPLVFAGSGSPRLTAAICRKLGIAVAAGEVIRFSEGTLFVRVLENVRGRSVYLVQSTVFPTNANFMELLFWIDAFSRASAESVTVVVPYFSYAKGDKKDEPRVSIRARVCADAIEGAGAERCLMMDLHSPQIQGFFHIPVDHLYARYVMCDHIKELKIPDLVVCSPDIGFAKAASAYANYLGVPVVIGNKTRRDHSERAEVLELIGDVEGRNVLITDDFTISGGTLIAMADVLAARGAKDIYAAVSHGALAKGVAGRIAASRIKKLFITDTIEPHQDPLPPNVW